jgi:hypothetical protein
MPTSAVQTPGAERTNCIAVCASVASDPSESRKSFGKPWATRPWNIEALEITVTPSADAATYLGIVALGHAVMRLIAGPAREDQLARRPWAA